MSIFTLHVTWSYIEVWNEASMGSMTGSRITDPMKSKLHPRQERLWCYTRNAFRDEDDFWYTTKPVGVNKMDTFLQDLSQNAGCLEYIPIIHWGPRQQHYCISKTSQHSPYNPLLVTRVSPPYPSIREHPQSRRFKWPHLSISISQAKNQEETRQQRQSQSPWRILEFPFDVIVIGTKWRHVLFLLW